MHRMGRDLGTIEEAQQGKCSRLDIHLSVKSDCTLEMPSLQIFHPRDGKNHKIGNLLVCEVGMIGNIELMRPGNAGPATAQRTDRTASVLPLSKLIN